MSHKFRCGALWIGFAGLLAGEDFFPLAVGNRWEYREAAEPGKPVRTRVDELTGTEQVRGETWYVLKSGGETWRVRVDERNRLLALTGATGRPAVWVDFARQPGVPFDSAKFCVANGWLERRDDLLVRYLPQCGDAGITFERYRDGVGMVEQIQTQFAGARVWRLVKARIAGRELVF